MTTNTTFDDKIVPKEDYLIDKSNKEYLFANKTDIWGLDTNDVVVIKKENNKDTTLDIYSKLLELNPNSEKLYKTLINDGGYIEQHAAFQKKYCINNGISRLTYVRALNELTCRGIVKREHNKLYIAEKYNIFGYNHRQALVILL